DRNAVERNRPALRQEAPEQRAHEGALAAPVGPDDRGERAARRVERDAVHRRPLAARVAQHDVVEPDHVILRRRERKNGTPISAVTAPSGNSAGARTVCAPTSGAPTGAP